jgi:hypothetical protein
VSRNRCETALTSELSRTELDQVHGGGPFGLIADLGKAAWNMGGKEVIGHFGQQAVSTLWHAALHGELAFAADPIGLGISLGGKAIEEGATHALAWGARNGLVEVKDWRGRVMPF